MKTTSQNSRTSSPVHQEEQRNKQSASLQAKTLPAVRPFSTVPVQKKAVEEDVAVAEEGYQSLSPVRLSSAEASGISQAPVQGGFFSSLKDKFGGSKAAQPEEIEMGLLGGGAQSDEEAQMPAAAPQPGLWDRAKAGLSSAGSAISSGASSLWGKTKSAASTAGTAIGDGASWLWGKTKAGASAAGTAISEGASKAWDKTKAGASAAGTAISEGASKAWEGTKAGASWIGDKAVGAKNAASAFMNKDSTIDAKNRALGSGLPTAMTGAGLYSAISTGTSGALQQGKSVGGDVAGSLGVIGGGVSTILGGAEMVQGIRSGDARRGILGAADFASGGLSVASGALSIAGTTGAAIPGLGVAAAGLDTVAQTGKGIYAHSQMNKLAALQQNIKARNSGAADFGTLSPGEGYSGDLKKQYALFKIAQEAMDVRRKQRNRAAVNAVGSGLETAGHATVVGAGVTGVGAAVGMGLVGAGKGIKGIAALGRMAKQGMIDRGWMGKGESDERTTKNKAIRADQFVTNVMENYDDPDVHQAMDLLGANKEQMEALKKGELPRADIYKLYKAR